MTGDLKRWDGFTVSTWAIHKPITEQTATEPPPVLASLAQRLADRACEEEGIAPAGPIRYQVVRPAFPDTDEDGNEVWPLPRLIVDIPVKPAPRSS